MPWDFNPADANVIAHAVTFSSNVLFYTFFLVLRGTPIPPLIINQGLPLPLHPNDVKRILPKTSEKFYLPKTLLSVSWKGISALIDPDERKVVQVWKEGTNTNIKQ
ncbi:hypothetical protein METP3_00615 [Methanosarcinales archaeon]|nr:hypothetical protein METP3_00615 [Methanosarcinales archaeon]